MHPETQITPKLPQLSKIKENLLFDARKYLKAHQREVLQLASLSMIDDETRIGEEFFDDFLVNRILFYMPTDLKDILGLCLEEPMIVADLARCANSEPTPLLIIKDAVRFYFKDFVYKKMPDLVEELAGDYQICNAT